MIRSIATLLFAGCLVFQMWAQTSPATPAQAPPPSQPAAQAPAVAPTGTGQPAAASESQFPLDRFQEFSAIETGGILPFSNWEGHVYRSGNFMRMQAVNAGKTHYFINDLKKTRSWGMSAAGCVRLKLLYSRSFPFFLSGPGYSYERIPVGEETVDGHQCKVEDIKVNSPTNPQQLHFRLWEAEDLQGFPVKIENLREHVYHWVIKYKDVVLGPQDPTLFVVPTKCGSLSVLEEQATSSAKKKTPAPAGGKKPSEKQQ